MPQESAAPLSAGLRTGGLTVERGDTHKCDYPGDLSVTLSPDCLA